MLCNIIIASLLTISHYHSMSCAGNTAYPDYHRLMMLSSLTAVLAMESMYVMSEGNMAYCKPPLSQLNYGAATKCNVLNDMSKGVKWTPLYSPDCLPWTLSKPAYQQNTSGHLSLVQSLGAFAQHKKQLLASSCPYICLSFCRPARNNVVPTGWIFMKFDIRIFKNLSRKFRYH